MNESAQGLWNRASAIWSGLDHRQRVLAGILGVAGLTLLLSLGFWAQTPDYAVAYTGLSEQDAGAIVAQLKKLNIPYQLSDNGSVIRVPAQRVAETRLALAQQGLPKGDSVGFELFDSGQLGNLGMTEFLQKLNYQRALEGELSRTINALEAVEGSRVHIVIPESSLFLDEEKKPTASVLLQLRPGERLNREQVQGISYLVASSVEGLQPDDVTIVDVQGHVLSAASTGAELPSSLQASTAQIEVKRRFERDAEAHLQAVLDQALGPGKALVRVSATFDWDRVEKNSETYVPPGSGGGVVRSSRQLEEYGEPASAVGGIPGTTSNVGGVPSYQSPVSGTNELRYVRRDQTYNYEISKVVENSVKAPGTIKRLSVAVLLDDSLPAEQAAAIESMVAAAIGADTSRGDTVVVERLAFDDSFYKSQQKALAEERRQELYMVIAKTIAAILGLVVVIFFVRGLLRDLSRRAVGPVSPYVLSLEEVEAKPPKELGTEADHLSLPEPVDEVGQHRRQIMHLAQKRPEVLAQVVQSWLEEDSD
ncbi:MAG TPA: flagellar M-ring protein FliF [Anaerolineae bacterium]|nr:flagellar M-ring protein FliF [Anaerolineae bacterium]